MSEQLEIKNPYTFWKLIHEYAIEIPIIQRDYAQGRSSSNASEIRRSLLSNIFNAINNKKNLDFDFIYGTAENGILYPLDGQQRLTTLFLLHWYAAEKDDAMDEAAEYLKKFSYTTRASSREFCELLVNTKFVPEREKPISSVLQNENGYFQAWNADASISGMLTMLDSIHNVFFNVPELFETLVDKDLLTFSFLPMNHYSLTDDLYIKMNSRGKALTVFENFKAKYLQHLHENNLPSKYFEEKIDKEWTDLLWGYRREDNLLDEQFMNLFTFITEMLYLESEQQREGESPFSPDDINAIIQYYDSAEKVNALFSYLDIWKSKEDVSICLLDILSDTVSDDRVRIFDEEPDLFNAIVSGKSVSIQNKLVLFAIMRRIKSLGVERDNTEMKKYIRIIRNYVQGIRTFVRKKAAFTPDFRYGRHGMPTVKNLIAPLSISKNVYVDFIELSSEGLNGEVIEQEIKKINIFKNSQNVEKYILSIENLDVFKGQIFNIMPYIENHAELCPVEHIEALFESNKNTSIVRALLSLGDYGIRLGTSVWGDRYFYGNYDNWYITFTFNGDENYSNIISNFIDQFDKSEAETVEDALNDVINMNLPNISKDDWRYTIVKYPVALDKEMKYISRDFVVLAKEKIATGDIIVHRANGYFMVGYHVIPEYMIVNSLNDASQDVGRAIRGYSGEHSGKVIQGFNEEIALKLNDKGGLTVEFNKEDDEWVSAAITEYDAINVDDFDRVERMMRMESLLKNHWEKHLIKQK